MYSKAYYFQQCGSRIPISTSQAPLNGKIIIPIDTSVPRLNDLQGKGHPKRRRKSQISTDNALPSFNLPGLEKVMNSPNLCHKLVWMVAVLVFYGLCIYQLVDRVTLYFTAPTALDISISTVDSVEFPSVTICPPFSEGLLKYKYIELKTNNQSLAEIDVLEEIWQEFKIRIDEVSIEGSQCTYTKPPDANKENDTYYDKGNDTSCDEILIMAVKPFLTFWGTCLRTSPTKLLTYRGAWTFISFNVSRRVEPSNQGDKFGKNRYNNPDKSQNEVKDKPQQGNSPQRNFPPKNFKMGPVDMEKFRQLKIETVFVPHDRHVLPTYELTKQCYSVNQGSKVNLRFERKQFAYLNTKKNPCVNKKVATDCKLECLKNRLKETVQCSMQYMANSSLPPCNTIDDALAAQLAVEKVYKEFDDCNCPRPCFQTVLSFDPDIHAIGGTAAVFYLYYPDNIQQLITERYSYTFSALLSDVGGSLGFCVGLSLFSLIEFFVYPLQLISNSRRRKREYRIRRPPIAKLPKDPHFKRSFDV